VDTGAEPIQEGSVGGVAERLTARKRSNGEFESDRREQNRRLLDRQRLRLSPFDPAVLSTGNPDGSGYIDAAEAPIESRATELLEYVGRHRSTPSRTDVHVAFSASHAASMTVGDYPAVIEVTEAPTVRV
jgi:hypothetical protein